MLTLIMMIQCNEMRAFKVTDSNGGDHNGAQRTQTNASEAKLSGACGCVVEFITMLATANAVDCN